ncbi:uncharacterized protein EDB91DRAFT_1255081 [Suillus paluster]|uniref:uncharacterized protein n=1 Tax=Suillus paluster TaxID=48578 RepID=UPI001B874F48|nr:uncharacterized protein EDB91DRAFT_1255081 [Suillus paluster]KAG1724752.1 hypothetical protein EDB91DRAFT_1255081 [Suillus paluster]
MFVATSQRRNASVPHPTHNPTPVGGRCNGQGLGGRDPTRTPLLVSPCPVPTTEDFIDRANDEETGIRDERCASRPIFMVLERHFGLRRFLLTGQGRRFVVCDAATFFEIDSLPQPAVNPDILMTSEPNDAVDDGVYELLRTTDLAMSPAAPAEESAVDNFARQCCYVQGWATQRREGFKGQGRTSLSSFVSKIGSPKRMCASLTI